MELMPEKEVLEVREKKTWNRCLTEVKIDLVRKCIITRQICQAARAHFRLVIMI